MINGGFVIRRALPADYANLNAIVELPQVKEWLIQDTGQTTDCRFPAILHLSNYDCFDKYKLDYTNLIEKDNVTIGMVNAMPLMNRRECVTGWYFHPSVWGSGIAFNVVGQIIERLRACKYYYGIRCCTSIDNLRCIGFMRKIGFLGATNETDVEKYYRTMLPPNKVLAAYCMDIKHEGYGLSLTELDEELVRDAFISHHIGGKTVVINNLMEYGFGVERSNEIYCSRIGINRQRINYRNLLILLLVAALVLAGAIIIKINL